MHLDVLAYRAVLLIVAGSFVASVGLTGLVRMFALRRDLIDTPNSRSSHIAPTPTGGGAAVLLSIILALLAGGVLGITVWRDVITFVVGMTALGAVGWLDDRHSVSAASRLTVHLLTALWTLARIGGFPTLSLGISVVPLGGFGWVLGVIGIVWSISLFNFMDGIDGLAGSQSIIIYGAASAGLWYCGDPGLSFAAAVIAAASAGFLIWNWPPAKIFLGDVGSGALGYLAAALALTSENRGAMPLTAFAILGGVLVADATVTLVRRVRAGHRPADAHREHAYQRLSRVWASHKSVTLNAAIVSVFLTGLAAIATTSARMLLPALLVAALLLGALLVAIERRMPMRTSDSTTTRSP